MDRILDSGAGPCVFKAATDFSRGVLQNYIQPTDLPYHCYLRFGLVFQIYFVFTILQDFAKTFSFLHELNSIRDLIEWVATTDDS